MRHVLRRIRGALGNAVVWGVGWFAGAFAAYGSLFLVGVLSPTCSWALILEAATNFGIIGSLAGVAFSGFIRLKYVDGRISSLSVGGFGVGGAAVAGIFVPVFIALGRFATGVPWLGLEPLLLVGAIAAALGGATAAGSLKLAQSATQEIGPPGAPLLAEGGSERELRGAGEAV